MFKSHWLTIPTTSTTSYMQLSKFWMIHQVLEIWGHEKSYFRWSSSADAAVSFLWDPIVAALLILLFLILRKNALFLLAASVSDSVKAEMLQQIRSFLHQLLCNYDKTCNGMHDGECWRKNIFMTEVTKAFSASTLEEFTVLVVLSGRCITLATHFESLEFAGVF